MGPISKEEGIMVYFEVLLIYIVFCVCWDMVDRDIFLKAIKMFCTGVLFTKLDNLTYQLLF